MISFNPLFTGRTSEKVCVNNLHAAIRSAPRFLSTFRRLAGHYFPRPMSVGLILAALVIFRLLRAASVCHWSLQKEATWLEVGVKRLFFCFLKQSDLKYIKDIGFTLIVSLGDGLGRGDAGVLRTLSPYPSVPLVGATRGKDCFALP